MDGLTLELLAGRVALLEARAKIIPPSSPVTLESLGSRVLVLEGVAAATSQPPDWGNLWKLFDQSPEGVAVRDEIHEEMRKYRAAERAELGLDDPEPQATPQQGAA